MGAEAQPGNQPLLAPRESGASYQATFNLRGICAATATRTGMKGPKPLPPETVVQMEALLAVDTLSASEHRTGANNPCARSAAAETSRGRRLLNLDDLPASARQSGGGPRRVSEGLIRGNESRRVCTRTVPARLFASIEARSGLALRTASSLRGQPRNAAGCRKPVILRTSSEAIASLGASYHRRGRSRPKTDRPRPASNGCLTWPHRGGLTWPHHRPTRRPPSRLQRARRKGGREDVIESGAV